MKLPKGVKEDSVIKLLKENDTISALFLKMNLKIDYVKAAKILDYFDELRIITQNPDHTWKVNKENLENYISQDKEFIETKYLVKYARLVKPKVYDKMVNEYHYGDVIFEPLRDQLTEEKQDEMYLKIDQTNSLPPEQRFEAIVGLMMILDGSFPDKAIVSLIGEVSGEELSSLIEEKREDFKDVIAKKTIMKLVNYYKRYYKDIENLETPRFAKLRKDIYRIDKVEDGLAASKLVGDRWERDVGNPAEIDYEGLPLNDEEIEKLPS